MSYLTDNYITGLSGSVIVGLNWNKTTDTYTRLGTAAGKSRVFFDSIFPWAAIRRCNINDSGLVTAYYGDISYAEDGSNGQVFVEYPAFYYKVDILSNGYNWWISSTPVAGFKLQPAFSRNGITKQFQYLGAFEASVYDVTASATEVNTLTINTGATVSGNITITLDGNYSYTVAVLSGDTATQVATKIFTAGNKTGYMGTVWTVANPSSGVVTFTAGNSGLKTTVVFTDTGTTSVTATAVKTTAGAGGYVSNDATGYDFTATTGDKLCSVKNMKPASGWNNGLTIVNTRILAKNRGSIFDQQDFLMMSAIQLLYLIEYGGFNSQSLLSAGVSNITDDGVTNMSAPTGLTSSLGNTSGQVSYTHYKTSQVTNPFSYRGLENPFGNLWKFVDGINIQNNVPYISDNGFISDQFTSPYINSGLTLYNVNDWVGDIKVSSAFDYMFLAGAGGGSSSTKITDYYYQASGNMIAFFGGGWDSGSSAGLFCWYLNYGSGFASRYIGGRLLKK